MRAAFAILPRAGGGSALLLLATTGVLIAAWPDRPDAANTSWYLVAAVRATGLALWAWLSGLRTVDPGAAEPFRTSLARLALGTLLTAPIEAVAHTASAPTASLAWSLLAPLPLAWTSYGLARGLARVALRLRAPAALPLLAAAVAAGLVFLDVRAGLGWWTPWTLSRTGSPGAAAVLTLASAAVLLWAWHTERPAPREENAA